MVKNYQLGKIYKMESPNGLIYIGSTCHPTLAMRKAKHKINFKHWQQGKYGYTTSYQLFEEDENNVQIYLIENYPCNNKDELTSREGYWIKKFDCVNKVIIGRTKQQWTIDNAEKLKEMKQEYYIDNKEKLKARSNKRYIEKKEEILKLHSEKINCECGITYTYGHKSRHFKTIKHLNYINEKTKLEELEKELNNL